MYNKGDYLVSEGQTYITTEGGQLILLREHPSANPNFSIKCSEYFGKNYFNIKTSVQNKQLSLTDGSVVDAPNYAVSDFIEIDESLEYAFATQASFFRVVFYDINKNFIESDSTEIVYNERWIQDLPTGAKYIRISAEYFTISDWKIYELSSEKAFAISYFNKKVEVNLQGFYGITRALVGTPDLFKLKYDSDTKDKGQTILSTTAEVNIFEDDFFNIDNLATSGETDIKIQYYENDIIHWSGFVLPDFFQTDLSNNRVVSMVATDRIGVLKEKTGATTQTDAIKLITEKLRLTGLELNINFVGVTTIYNGINFNPERIESKSAYDVLKSFLILFNCKLFQYKNEWYFLNKKTLEAYDYNSFVFDAFGDEIEIKSLHKPKIPINLFELDGLRKIKPVASDVSLKLEFGGSKKYPNNYDFSKPGAGSELFKDWTIPGLLGASNYNQVIGYDVIGTVQNAQYGSSTNIQNLKIRSGKIPALDGGANVLGFPHVKSSWSTLRLLAGVSYKLDIRLNFTSANDISVNLYVMTRKGTVYKVIGRDGSVGDGGSASIPVARIEPIRAKSATRDAFGVIQTQFNLEIDIDKTELGISDTDNDTIDLQYIIMTDRSYTSPVTLTDIFINSAELSLNDGENVGKGLIFKVKQGGARFSKSREEQTIFFSDKINRGINGFFYNYKYDDTSILSWTDEQFALRSAREQAEMFGKAREFLTISGDIEINPLAHYICADKTFVFVGGSSNRTNANLQLEEIVESDLSKIDYIYTYFED